MDETRQPSMAYTVLLAVLLCLATFFEGYDFFVMSLVLGTLGEEFHADGKTLFTMVALVNLGMLVAFFLVRQGETLGRKPLLVGSVFGYAVMSLATAFSPTLRAYMAFQFVTKVFLITSFSMAIIMMSEEMPAHRRGLFVGLVEFTSALGGAVAVLVSGRILNSPLGWRGMYCIGAVPVLLAPVMALLMKESSHFLKLKAAGGVKKESLLGIWKTDSAHRLVVVSALWFGCYLCFACITYVWPYFAEKERGWSPGEVDKPMSIALGLGMLGYLACGWMMDAWGRKPTAALFFVLGGASLIWAFTARPPFMLPSVVCAVFFVLSLIPAVTTLNAELFPTDRRAASMAWCNSIFGRSAQIVAPFLIGRLAAPMGGTGNVVCLLALGAFAAAAVVWKVVPETKGVQLDRVH